jgi:hypothetical protein
MGNIERWKISAVPMKGQGRDYWEPVHVVTGPGIPMGESVEVVPLTSYRGAVEAARRVLRDHEITDLEDGGRVYVDALALAELRDAVRRVGGQ